MARRPAGPAVAVLAPFLFSIRRTLCTRWIAPYRREYRPTRKGHAAKPAERKTRRELGGAGHQRNFTFLVRVTALGTATASGPRLDQWRMYFTFKGRGFAASAMRALDRTRFAIEGDQSETSAAPGFVGSTPVEVRSTRPAARSGSWFLATALDALALAIPSAGFRWTR
jgi:hypothetical protein